MLTSKRNYGIDLLRIVSMIMVVILHILLQGKILETFSDLSSHRIVACFLETASFCAVNCYALISGFTGYGRNFKPSGIVALWFQVFFYTVGLTLIFKFALPNSVDMFQMVFSFFPVSFGPYWYFTAYFVVFFFTPFLNHLVETLSKKSITLLIIAVVLIFSVLSTFSKTLAGDSLVIKEGYSPIWLAILYLIGAFIKKYQFGFRVKKRVWLIIYFVCVIITVFSDLAISFLSNHVGGVHIFKHFLIAYASPTILLCGISLLILFANLNLNPSFCKVISFFSASAFSVYIIHCHTSIWNLLDYFFIYTELNAITLMLAVIGTAIAVWLICSLVDKIRQVLFKLIRIDTFAQKIAKLAQKLINKIVTALHKLMA